MVSGTASHQKAAARYIDQGIAVIPVPHGEKNPNRRGWQNERWGLEDVARQWTNGQNVSVLLGSPSGDLIDVDLDVPELPEMAGKFLPPTRTSGRTSAKGSHHWYRCGGVRHHSFNDIDGTRLLEVRGDGHHTLVEPSVHPSGERYEWDRGSPPDFAEVGRGELLRSCRELATACLVARHLPPVGGRHGFALALAGFLLRKLDADTTERIMLAAWDAAGYPDPRDAWKAQRDLQGIVRDTAEKLRVGGQAVGGPTLDEAVPGIAGRIGKYWEWGREEPGGEDEAQAFDPEDARGLTAALADAVSGGRRFAKDIGGRLHHYEDGAYRPNGEGVIAVEMKRVLAESGASPKWSTHRAREVTEYVRVDAPELWERPPSARINVLNGIIDVDSGELLPHNPDFLSPVQIPVEYDPQAECPAWEKFVSEVFPDDAKELAFEVVGLLMTPDTSVQKSVLLLGEGANGKSTYLKAVESFVGDFNVVNTSLHKIESDRFAAARLVGKLANICPDLPSDHLTSTSVFKAITGGDKIAAERKYADGFDYRPFARLVFSANHPPRSGDASHAFYRRWLVVPFDRTFEPT